MLKINEIFHSIQGESTRAGLPTVFVRTSGCDLRCNYCDTKYAYHEGDLQSFDQIIEKVNSYGAKNVCVTGGEPLLQKSSLELINKLCDLGFDVSLETSGGRTCLPVDKRAALVIDIKTPGSDEGGSFNVENLKLPHLRIEYKFVICCESDFDWSENFCRQHEIFGKYPVLYSPSYEKIEARWLAEKILSTNSSARLHLQLHKYIWSPLHRGV